MKRKQTTTRQLPVPRAARMTFLERCRERETFFGRDTRNRASLPDVHGRKSVGRFLKKETRTCLRSGVGRREGERGGEGTLRSGKETSGVVVSGFASMGRKLHVPPPPVCMCVCQWFCRSNNRVRRSYVTIQATLLLVAYQSLPSLLKIDRSYDPWTRVILSLAFRLVSASRLRVYSRKRLSTNNREKRL